MRRLFRRLMLAALPLLIVGVVVAPEAGATPRPLWHAFPLGAQPLLQRTTPPGHSPVQRTPTAHAQPRSGARGGAADDGSEYSVTFAQVIVLTGVIAAVVVLTPALVIRRRIG